MLELKNITKVYDTNGFRQEALKGVSINFRKHEFVSILGQSGSGKTTLLNIIGGLDQYTSGNLVINGVATNEYNDRDWDVYRNRRIGFIFQNYNLIPHQTILANVELALTLSGVSKKERRGCAIEALEKVGLGQHIAKKPNQLSGGQMQRVAIARALINNPDIILADEPTGALDSNTAESVMETIREISKDKLIIMVTHNPEIAEKYSSRIIQLKDGVVVSDTHPHTDDDMLRDGRCDVAPLSNRSKKRKHSMGFMTALSLSLKNLMSKRGRTMLTSLAGSIGIIGIALVLAVSTGVQNYIDAVQQDTLSSFPIQIEKETTDMGALMGSLMAVSGNNGEDKSNRAEVYGNPVMYKMMKTMLNADVNTNNLEKLKLYIDAHHDQFTQYTSAIQYGYKIDLNVYATDPNGAYAKADFTDLLSGVMEGGAMMSGISSMLQESGGMTVWQELLTKPDSNEISPLISDQYDLIHGKWPSNADELLLVVNSNNEISDVTLYALGLVDRQTMMNATLAAMMGKEDNGWDKYEGKSWTYDDICNIPLKMILPTDYYQYDDSTKTWVDISENQALLNSVIDKGKELHIVGIVKPSEDATAAFLNGAICYTRALTQYYMEALNASDMVKAQRESLEYNIINGLPFVLKDTAELSDSEKVTAFRDYVAGLSDGEKALLYENILATPSENFIQDTINQILATYQDKTVDEIINDIIEGYADQLGYSGTLIKDMLSGYNKDDLLKILEQTAREMIVAQYKENAKAAIDDILSIPSPEEITMLRPMVMSEIYKSISSSSLTDAQREQAMREINIGLVATRLAEATGIDMAQALAIVQNLASDDFQKALNNAIDELVIEYYARFGGGTTDRNRKIAAALEQYLQGVSDADIVFYYNTHMPSGVSPESFNEVIKKLGVKTPESPDFIYMYPIDFESKDSLSNMISEYNQNVGDEDKIEYMDIAAMLMSSVSDIITAISVILIGFISISLVVSSIMIGIITYISVLERTKEIGILRAVGASKKDISRVFNAETVIVGLLAGIVGIATTLLLCIPINAIARAVTGIAALTASLPWYGYLLILLSVGLTLIAGLIPARMAARKDPVEALRAE